MASDHTKRNTQIDYLSGPQNASPHTTALNVSLAKGSEIPRPRKHDQSTITTYKRQGPPQGAVVFPESGPSQRVDNTSRVLEEHSPKPNRKRMNTPICNDPPLPAAKTEDPWNHYEKGYELDVGANVTVVRKRSTEGGKVGQISEVAAIRKLSGQHASFVILRQLQGDHLVKFIDAYIQNDDIWIVQEYMPLCLVHVIGAPVRSTEAHAAAILGQLLYGIQFLESKGMVHGHITCSNILLNDSGDAKIHMQECSVVRPEGDSRDVQAVAGILLQLLEKCSESQISDMDALDWTPSAKDFRLQASLGGLASDLSQHAFLQNWAKEDLLLLISFARVSSRRFYSN